MKNCPQFVAQNLVYPADYIMSRRVSWVILFCIVLIKSQNLFFLFLSYIDNRGFMTANGQPDNPRSSRYVLKDFVNGRLLHCVAPPGVLQSSFHQFPDRSRTVPRQLPPATLRATKGSGADKADTVDRSFFKTGPGFHFKGRHAVPSTR